MEAGRKHLLTVAAVGLALAIAINIARGLFGTPGDIVRDVHANRALLHVEPNALDFGDVAATDRFTWQIPVRNTLDRRVRIEKFMTSCSCAGIEPESAELAPGETRNFLVKLDLFQGRTGEATYGFAESIYPVVSSELGDYEPWVVRGQVHEVFRFEPETVRFGGETIVGTVPETQVISAIPYHPCADVTCRVVPEHASVQVSRESDGRFRLHVSPRAMDTAGDHSFRLLLMPRWSGPVERTSRRPHPVGERAVYVSYEVVEPVESFPTYDHLGFVKIGQTREESCALRPREGGDIVVERFAVLSSDAAVLSHDPLEKPLSEFHFRIACTPSAEGEQQATVRFHIAHPDDDRTTTPRPVPVRDRERDSETASSKSATPRAYSYDFHLYYRAQHNVLTSSNGPDLAEPDKASEVVNPL